MYSKKPSDILTNKSRDAHIIPQRNVCSEMCKACHHRATSPNRTDAHAATDMGGSDWRDLTDSGGRGFAKSKQSGDVPAAPLWCPGSSVSRWCDILQLWIQLLLWSHDCAQRVRGLFIDHLFNLGLQVSDGALMWGPELQMELNLNPELALLVIFQV